MPEGDIVFRTAARLRAALAQQVLTRSDFRIPSHAEADLRGETIESVASYGKHLFLRTSTVSMHSHLGMDGSWQVFHHGQRWTQPRVTARIVLATADCEAVGFALRTLELLPPTQEHEITDRLGPDPLGDTWDPEEVLRRLHQQPTRPLGIALLDQHNLAGIGNIYRNEVCFARRIHPATPVGAVDNLLAVVNEAQRALSTAVGQPATRRYVYGRARRPCPRCGTRLRAELLGETGPDADRITQRERGIYYCPHCQPPP